jgi:hypothetical protein
VQLTTHGETLLQKLVAQHLDELAPKCEPLIRALRELQRPADDDPEAGTQA